MNVNARQYQTWESSYFPGPRNWTFRQLCKAMMDKIQIIIATSDGVGHTGYIQGIRMAVFGNGWLVKLDSEKREVFVPLNNLSSPRNWTFRQLCEAMQEKMEVVIATSDGVGHTGYIQGIRMEDGSGKCWLVKLNTEEKEVFVRAS